MKRTYIIYSGCGFNKNTALNSSGNVQKHCIYFRM